MIHEFSRYFHKNLNMRGEKSIIGGIEEVDDMLHVVTSDEMRAMDANTINNLKVPSAVLMERAALGIFREVERAAKDRSARILIVCGTGNNGGDGAALARILFIKGYQPELYIVGNETRFSADMAAQMASCRLLKVQETAAPDMNEYDIIVDAVFGTGLARDVEGRAAETIMAINESPAFVIAADIPSGISADTGSVCGCAVQANVTVTMECAKAGELLYPGALYTGRLVIEEIGIYDDTKLLEENPYRIFALTDDDIGSLLPKRDPSGNKGTFGKVLVIAGSKGMCGAALFAAEAALRSGCGMVKILTEEANRIIVQTALPEALLETYERDEDLPALIERNLAWADVAAAGPGLGNNSRTRLITEILLATCRLPLVIDADGLNVIGKDTQLLSRHEGALFITPHMGEMARLTGKKIYELKNDPVGEALAFAGDSGAQVLLKDARTVIADPGGLTFINTSGNAGMAAAGSGDVLTGILAGLLAQGTEPAYAGALAAFLHGRAGDRAKAKCGELSMLASDIIKALADIPEL